MTEFTAGFDRSVLFASPLVALELGNRPDWSRADKNDAADGYLGDTPVVVLRNWNDCESISGFPPTVYLGKPVNPKDL